MIRLRTLGSLDLRTDDGASVESVLAQPRRLALLAHLALGMPGYRRRDHLHALFWPERDAASARHALRQALYFLRRALGKGVVVSRGQQEIGLSPERFWCDAASFQEAIAGDRLDEALGLYGGDLLDGFFAAGAPDFERWLEDERLHLRDQAAAVAWRVAAAKEAAGDAAAAVAAARAGSTLAPTDEVAFRRLLALMDRVGDRAGAVRAFDEFAARLRDVYDLEPSAETVGALAAIRGGPGSGPDGAGGEPGLGEAAAGVGGPELPVAVFPFSDTGPLGETLAELVSADLKETWLRPVEPRRVRGAARSDGAASNPDAARAVTAGLGARGFVLGSVVRGAGTVRAMATLYDAAGRELGLADAAVAVDGEPMDLSADLARQLLAAYWARLSDAGRQARDETRSVAALHHFYEGEAHLAAARLGRAIDAYRRAVTADPVFVSAWARMAFAAAWALRTDVSEEAGARASALADRLDEPDASQLEALLHVLEGDAARAEHRYRTLLETYPEAADAWAGLGMVQLVTYALRGRPIAESRSSFERAVELAPTVLHPLVPQAYLAALERRDDDFARIAARLGPDQDFAPVIFMTQVFTHGDQAARDEQIARLAAMPDLVIHEAARYVAHLTPDLEGAIRIARLLTDPARIPEVRATGHAVVAHLELTLERPDRARAELDATHRLDPDVALEHQALFAVVPFLPASDDELAGLRARVRRRIAAGPPTSPRPRGPFALHDDLRVQVWTYLHGLLSARLGDETAALAEAVALEGDLRSAAPGPLLRDLGRGIRSYLAEHQGDTASALAILEEAEPIRPLRDLMFQSPFHSGFLERFRRGRLLVELGRPDEARPWLESITESAVWGQLYAAEARRMLEAVPAE